MKVQIGKFHGLGFDQPSRFQLLTKSLTTASLIFFEQSLLSVLRQGITRGDNNEMERLTLSVGRTVISIYFKAAECGDAVELYVM